MDKIVDYKYAKKLAQGYPIRVTLKKGPKGVSLFAVKSIKKGNIIAYYKFKVFSSNHKGFRDGMYEMSVYDKNGKYLPRYIGDVYEGSLEKPKRGITYWAYFSNEPSESQIENAFLDSDEKGNYKHRDKVYLADTMVYKLKAARDIKKGEEIVWCYGDFYDRHGYVPNCD